MDNTQYTEEEFSIKQYVNVIRKRKKMIVSVFVLSILIAVVFNALTPSIYKTTAIIQNGYVTEEVMKTREIEETIKSYGFLTPVMKKLNLEERRQILKNFIDVSNIKDTNYSKVVVTYPDADISLRLCRELVNLYIDLGNSVYQKKIELIRQQADTLKKQIELIEDGITNIKELIHNLGTAQKLNDSEKSIRLLLLQSLISNYESNLQPLLDKYGKLQSVLSTAQEFKVIDLPMVPGLPLQSNKALNLAIGALLGLFAGVLWAFVAEFLKNTK